MRLEILYFDSAYTGWFAICTSVFSLWIVTEKWWSSGNELTIGIRFGKNVFEKRWIG